MADQQGIEALTDDELKAVADSPEMVAKLTSAERRRLNALKPRTWTDTAVDQLPNLGAILGGTVGGIGGTAFGMGVGGVPGAIGGAGLGGGAGEATKQLINRLRGANAPETPTQAAMDIGIEGAKDAAITGAGAGVGKVASMMRPGLASWLQVAGKQVARPHALKRAVGTAMQSAGKALETTQKPSLTALEFNRLRGLVAQGISEKDALEAILKLRALKTP